MTKYFIDTNIFLRTLIKEDKNTFEACFRLLQNIKTNQIKGVTSSLNLSEVVWTLNSYYNFPKNEVVKALKSIINLRGLTIIDKYQPDLAVSLFETKGIKFIDAMIASNPDIYNKHWAVISYDKDFDKLEINRLEPDRI